MFVTAITDAVWTLYFIAVEKRKAVVAGIWSAIIMLGAAFNILSYTENKLNILAAIIGAFVGTFLTVKLKKEK